MQKTLLKFSTSNALLQRAMSKVIGVVNKSSSLDYLSCVKVSVTSQVTIEAFNADVITNTWFDIEEGASHGSFCVDAHAFAEIVKKLPKESVVNISMEKLNDGLEYLVIQTGKSRFDIATLDPEDFPNMQVASRENSITLSKQDVSFLIDKTKTCIYPNETRYNIHGMLLHFREDVKKIKSVATDGHRLACCEVEHSAIDFTKKITIPKKSVFEIRKILDFEEGDVTLDISSNKITFNFESSRFTTKLVDADFPDYERVIPKDYTDFFSVNAKHLLSSIDRVSSVYSGGMNEIGIRFNVNQTSLKVSSNKDINKGSDELPAVFTKESEMLLMCNFAYMKDVLSLIDSDDIKIFVKDQFSPILAKDVDNSDFFYVIMPMKNK